MSDTTAQPKKKRKMLTSFSIIFILLALVAIISILLNGTSFHYEDIQGTVTGATLGSFTMASVNGFKDAVDVCLFVMVLGGFLGIVNKTDALATGIDVLVAKMNGNELKLIPILMLIFAFGGTTYGMCEETVGFYALLSATMIAAGYDSLSGAMIVLLGAGVGCLGSTVNPFATGIASSALTDMGIKVNQAVVIGLGLVLLVVSYAIAVFFVLQYAKRVKADPSKSLMSQDEIDASLASYANDSDSSQKKSLTGKQKGVLWVFAAAFIIMVISFVPWEDLGVNAFVAGSSSHDETSTVTAADIEQQYSDDDLGTLKLDKNVKGKLTTTVTDNAGWSAFLTGTPLGQWYFAESTTWFL
ncbi:MAG: YfcC family protein, partial [Parafannyhessea umbonata]|nr:YfcC family protein [Parafannyhessea umbonata]